MIPTKPRRIKTIKLPKNLERLYKQSKCRDCTVVVTRMDFAKILGKFTKVKIQFETNTPKTKRTIGSSPASRLKINENGTVVQSHKCAFKPHPAKKLLGIGKKTRNNEVPASPPRTPNILKENNRIKKMVQKDTNLNVSKSNTKVKNYKIIFANPTTKQTEVKTKINLDSLLPSIDNEILPSGEWCIDYFPKKGEPKDDKIYDRIAAELEDLMYNEKTKNGEDKEGKGDEFPSILDILNDTSKTAPEKPNIQSPVNLESSDVEAMLLGKSNSSESLSMSVDKKSISRETTHNPEGNEKTTSALDDNPKSPSILEEPSQMDIPVLSLADKPLVISPKKQSANSSQLMQIDENDNTNAKNKNNLKSGVTQVIFKKTINGTSSKTVICPKNLKYSISIQGKSIELLGAPKVISCLEDLQVLLQIVEESELTSVYLLQ